MKSNKWDIIKLEVQKNPKIRYFAKNMVYQQ